MGGGWCGDVWGGVGVGWRGDMWGEVGVGRGVMLLSVGQVLCLYTTLNVTVLFRDIEDLHDIGKNIAVMVVGQGEAVNNVEANVNSAADRVAGGAGELKKVGACSSTSLSCCSESSQCTMSHYRR